MVRKATIIPGLVAIVCGVAAGQGPYTVTELGLLPGSWSTVPIAMNNAGKVVGWANMGGVGGGVRAFLWTPGAGMVQIGPAGMTNTRAVDITDSGLVLGIGYQSPAHVGWIYDGVGYELLPPFPGGTTTCSLDNFYVSAFNEAREVVGGVCVGTNLQFHPFYYSPQTGYIDLTNQYGVASALAINEAGVITGSAFGQAYRLTLAGGIELLGTLPDPFDDGAAGTAVNATGVTVGVSTRWFTGGSIWYRSFRYDSAMQEIAPTYLERSAPRGINAHGHVVGNIGPDSSPDRDPWLWTPATGTIDLTFPLGAGPEWTRFTNTRAINDRGQILLKAYSANPLLTASIAVILTPEGGGCYPDCNADGSLTVADFGCFQTKFVAADPYADCNGNNVFTVADFGCFQTAFVAGCP